MSMESTLDLKREAPFGDRMLADVNECRRMFVLYLPPWGVFLQLNFGSSYLVIRGVEAS